MKSPQCDFDLMHRLSSTLSESTSFDVCCRVILKGDMALAEEAVSDAKTYPIRLLSSLQTGCWVPEPSEYYLGVIALFVCRSTKEAFVAQWSPPGIKT